MKSYPQRLFSRILSRTSSISRRRKRKRSDSAHSDNSGLGYHPLEARNLLAVDFTVPIDPSLNLQTTIQIRQDESRHEPYDSSSPRQGGQTGRFNGVTGVPKSDRDQIGVSSSDTFASEVPGNMEYDTAKIRFYREEHSERGQADLLASIAYFSVTIPHTPEQSRYLAALNDWSLSSRDTIFPIFQVGQILVEGGYNPVFSIAIPEAESFIELDFLANWDNQYEANETVEFKVVPEFQFFNGTTFIAPYEVIGEPVEITIIDRTADIDFEFYDDFEEDDPGIPLNQNLEDEPLHRVTFRSLIPDDAGHGDQDFFTLSFNPETARFWFNPDKSNLRDENGEEIPGSGEITQQTRFNEDEKTFLVYMEVVAERMGSVDLVGVIWHRGDEALGNQTHQTDSFKYTTFNIDVDIDSDNNGVLENSAWEDYIEDHPYALGKLITSNGDANSVVPMSIRLPRGLNPHASRLRFYFSELHEYNPAGNVKIFVNHGDVRVMKNVGYFLSNIGYDPTTGYVNGLLVEGAIEAWTSHASNPGRIFTLEQLRILSPEVRGKIKVVLDFDDGNGEWADTVTYVVSNPKSIFWDIVQRPELRAAFASHGVYELNDLPKLGLQWQNNEMLSTLGLLGQSLNNETEFEGFTAALYRDFTAGPNGYFLAYAGTDFNSLQDWLNNFSQGVGAGSGQYFIAMKVSRNILQQLSDVTAHIGPLNLSTTGHSLGGGLASAASVRSDLPGYTFNAAGLLKVTVKQFIELEGLPMDEANNIFGRYETEASGGSMAKIRAYYDVFDILSLIQDSTGAIQSAIGIRNPRWSNGEGRGLVSFKDYRNHRDAIDAANKLQIFVNSNVGSDKNGLPTWHGRPWEVAVGIIVEFVTGGGFINGMTMLTKSHNFYRYGLLQYFNPEMDLYGNFDYGNLG